MTMPGDDRSQKASFSGALKKRKKKRQNAATWMIRHIGSKTAHDVERHTDVPVSGWQHRGQRVGWGVKGGRVKFGGGLCSK